MVFVSLILAPLVMAAAALIERRLGPSAAGWVAALPIAFSVAVVAVSLDAGSRPAGTMALSAATHVPAQVVFGVVFAGVLMRRGVMFGATAGTAAYVASSVLIADVPAALAVASAMPVLAFAPRFMVAGRPWPGSRRRWSTTALSCVAASAIVGAAVVTSRVGGPEAAGAVAAFPTISTILTLTVVTRDGRAAGAHALTGLVRSLPCYLTFCLVVACTAPSAGVAAVALGLLACLAAARATWRGVPVARRAALAR
ncbi:MAG TPA: hypothetical protein VGJ70_12480 [Solirubrobacteraceae bacterium]